MEIKEIDRWSGGGYVIVFEDKHGQQHIIQVLRDIFVCPGFNCDMHDTWCTAILKEPTEHYSSATSSEDRFNESHYLVRKSEFHNNPEKAIELGFDHKRWLKHAYGHAAGIKAFKELECRQRYLKEVGWDPDIQTIWHDEYIDNYDGTAYY